MFGIIFAIVSGISMSIQGVFNTRLSEKIGLWETTVMVQGIAFVCSILISLFIRDGSYAELKNPKR